MSQSPTPQLNGDAAAQGKYDIVVVLATQDHARVQICERGPRYEYGGGGGGGGGGITLPPRVKDAWGIDQSDLDDIVVEIMGASELHGQVPSGIDYTAMPDLLAACRAVECYVADWFRLKMAEHGPGWVGRAAPSVLDDLRAAIAKATGGAA